MCKPVIITAMHGRSEMTRAFCMSAQRIYKDTGVKTFSVITRNDYENIRLCIEYGIEYIEFRNNPLGAKWNAVLRLIEDTDYTHAIVLGSDDIASTSYIQYLIDTPCDFVGTPELYFLGLNPNRDGYGEFIRWVSNTQLILGVGRMVSRWVVEQCNYTLWDDDIQSGLDRSMLDRVRPISRVSYSFSLGDDLFLMDVKYKNSISSLAPMLRRCERADIKLLDKFLPKEEVEYLNGLQK